MFSIGRLCQKQRSRGLSGLYPDQRAPRHRARQRDAAGARAHHRPVLVLRWSAGAGIRGACIRLFGRDGAAHARRLSLDARQRRSAPRPLHWCCRGRRTG